MNKIEKTIVKKQVKTITIDIFDTILMRDRWPEDGQFLEVAKKWLPLFKEEISDEITAEQLYYWRQYVRDEIIGAHYTYQPNSSSLYNYEYDTNLNEWFSEIVNSLQNLYGKKSSNSKKLVSKMIKIELETELQHLKPNHKLIKKIQDIKDKYPDIRVFFVSDMYLSSEQIKGLLESLDITIFENGVSSSDVLHSKHTGTLFHYLKETDHFNINFDICHNLHLGDNKISDYKNSRRAGSYAILTSTSLNRRIRTNTGKIALKCLHSKNIKKAKKNTACLKKLNTKSFDSFWYQYGILFSQPLFSFLFHISFSKKHAADETKFIMVSSEAAFFNEIAKQHYGNLLEGVNIEVANKLNRRCIIRALLWTIIRDDIDVNSLPIFKTIRYGETSGSRYEIYRFLFGDEYPISELVLNLRKKQDFFKALISDLKKPENKKYLSELEESYNYAKNFLPENPKENIIITDVGWGGTVQVLFEAFAKMHNHRGKIKGLYLGSFPDPKRFAVEDLELNAYLMPDVHYGKNRSLWNAVMWEYAYTNKIQFPGDQARLECIRRGIDDGVKYFQNSIIAPKDYFDFVISKYLKRLISKPRRSEVFLIGDIEFDCGFIEKTKFRIVDTGYTHLELYKMLLLHPRRTIRKVIFKPNCWPSGYISYYHLKPLRWAITLLGKIKNRHYF